jgi:hypothetical protein
MNKVDVSVKDLINLKTSKIQILKEILKGIGFANEIGYHTNKRIPNLYSSAKDNKLTIGEYIDMLEDDSKQHTVVTTAQISYLCVKDYLSFKANDFLIEKTEGYVKILNKIQYQSHKDYYKFEKLSFDIVFEVGGELIPLEIKVSQGKDGFTGATHSTSKVNDYLLISLDIDKSIIVSDDVSFIKGIFMSLTTIDSKSWNGKASTNNSFTSFKFNVFDSNENIINYDDDVIIGKLDKKQKFYSIVTESIY